MYDFILFCKEAKIDDSLIPKYPFKKPWTHDSLSIQIPEQPWVLTTYLPTYTKGF
jgi:hypothetical protein